jgi:multidrug efflux system membrane fusion protein
MSTHTGMSKYIFRLSVGLMVVASCSKPAAPPTPRVPVQTSSVVQISAPVNIIANGVVEPLQTVAVQAQVGGTLDGVEFREGDDVVAGQILFRLDPRPFEAALRQAQAQLARDEAQAQNAVRETERYKSLVEKDYVTKSQADQIASAATAARATVQADSATVDNAKLNLNYATIRSPIAGRTGRLLVRQGNLVRPGSDPLVVVNQLRPILVRFPLAQHDFPTVQRRFAQGKVPVRVTTAAGARVLEQGELGFLDNAVDSLTGTVTAKARFANQTSGLWPGEYVNVSVELEVQSDVTAVPTRAVLSGQTGNYVFVVRGDNTAEVRPVTAGRAVGEFTTIDKGLQAGEQVVVDGQSRLTPNARVDAKPATGVSATTQAAK